MAQELSDDQKAKVSALYKLTAFLFTEYDQQTKVTSIMSIFADLIKALGMQNRFPEIIQTLTRSIGTPIDTNNSDILTIIEILRTSNLDPISNPFILEYLVIKDREAAFVILQAAFLAWSIMYNVPDVVMDTILEKFKENFLESKERLHLNFNTENIVTSPTTH